MRIKPDIHVINRYLNLMELIQELQAIQILFLKIVMSLLQVITLLT